MRQGSRLRVRLGEDQLLRRRSVAAYMAGSLNTAAHAILSPNGLAVPVPVRVHILGDPHSAQQRNATTATEDQLVADVDEAL